MIFTKQDYFITWTWSFTFRLALLKLLVPARKSESYSSLKEKRKSLTPVIIVLSPSSHVLLAECLTDPAGKSFTPHLLRQPSQERSFYLPASVSHSFCLSNCSLCSRSTVLSGQRNITHSFFFLTIRPWRCVVSAHLRMISRDPPCMLAVYPTSPDHRPFLVLATVLLPGPQSVFGSRSSHSRTRSCLTVLPRRIPPCRLFDLITMPASRRERR